MLNDWINKTHLNKASSLKKSFNKQPFPHHLLKNFLIPSKITKIIKIIDKEKYSEKNTDLFHIHQTQDLKFAKTKALKEFYQFISSREFISFIEKITNKRLSKKIDVSSLKLKKINYLLCHDDQLSNRKLAFILYLTTLKKSDGGSLSFFTAKNKKPHEVIKSFYPVSNSFMIFEVSDKSFHQIDEVLSGKQRITIGGWFHD